MPVATGRPIRGPKGEKGDQGFKGDQGAPGKSTRRLRYVLSAVEIARKSIELPDEPSDVARLTLFPHGGPPQFVGVTLKLHGKTLTWADSILERLLETGETIFVEY